MWRHLDNDLEGVLVVADDVVERRREGLSVHDNPKRREQTWCGQSCLKWRGALETAPVSRACSHISLAGAGKTR